MFSSFLVSFARKSEKRAEFIKLRFYVFRLNRRELFRNDGGGESRVVKISNLKQDNANLHSTFTATTANCSR